MKDGEHCGEFQRACLPKEAVIPQLEPIVANGRAQGSPVFQFSKEARAFRGKSPSLKMVKVFLKTTGWPGWGGTNKICLWAGTCLWVPVCGWLGPQNQLLMGEVVLRGKIGLECFLSSLSMMMATVTMMAVMMVMMEMLMSISNPPSGRAAPTVAKCSRHLPSPSTHTP